MHYCNDFNGMISFNKTMRKMLCGEISNEISDPPTCSRCAELLRVQLIEQMAFMGNQVYEHVNQYFKED